LTVDQIVGKVEELIWKRNFYGYESICQ
jgi:hypothetical protein